MNWIDACGLVDHPARDAWRLQARDDNPDLEQRDAARATLVRFATGEEPPRPAPTPEDLALRAHVTRHGCCGH